MGIAHRTIIRHTNSEKETIALLLSDVVIYQNPIVTQLERTCRPEDFGTPDEFDTSGERRHCELAREQIACGLIRKLRVRMPGDVWGTIMTNEDGTRAAWLVLSTPFYSDDPQSAFFDGNE